MSDDLNFDDLEPIEIPFRYQGVQYLLREASEGAAIKYRNALTGAARMQDRAIVGMNNLADAEPLLVSLCTFHAVKGPNGTLTLGSPVALPTILAWPSRVVAPLFRRIKEISDLGLDEEQDTPESIRKRMAADQAKLSRLESGGEDAAKNGLLATPSTSA